MQKLKMLKQKKKIMLPKKSSIKHNLNQSRSSFFSQNDIDTWFELTEGYSLEDYLNLKLT